MGDDTCSRGRGFKSWRHILDGHDIYSMITIVYNINSRSQWMSGAEIYACRRLEFLSARRCLTGEPFHLLKVQQRIETHKNTFFQKKHWKEQTSWAEIFRISSVDRKINFWTTPVPIAIANHVIY